LAITVALCRPFPRKAIDRPTKPALRFTSMFLPRERVPPFAVPKQVPDLQV
jgi:hypothetical protein